MRTNNLEPTIIIPDHIHQYQTHAVDHHPQGLITDYVLGLNTGSNPKYMIILCMITITLKIPRMSAFYVKNNYIAIVKVNATLIFPRINYFD